MNRSNAALARTFIPKPRREANPGYNLSLITADQLIQKRCLLFLFISFGESSIYFITKKKGLQVPSYGPPVRHSLQMPTKPVATRATTATRARCVWHGVGHAEDPRPNILQLNTEGLTANKISVIEQLAYKNKAFIIVLQETQCTTADKLLIPNFSLAGSVMSRNHGLTTFVHERLE